METPVFSLTVLFEEPFWIALCERIENGRYEACKVTFGAEPKDGEVWTYFLQNWRRLRFSPPIRANRMTEKRINPKRMQREIRQTLQNTGVGTKAQQALKLQQEQGKRERRVRSREEREAEEQRRFELSRQKRKEKHKGR